MAVKFSGGFKPPQGLKVANIEQSPWKPLGEGTWGGGTSLSHAMFKNGHARIFPFSNEAVLGEDNGNIYIMQSNGSSYAFDVQFANSNMYIMGVNSDKDKTWLYNPGGVITELNINQAGGASLARNISYGFEFYIDRSGGQNTPPNGYAIAEGVDDTNNTPWFFGSSTATGTSGTIRGRRPANGSTTLLTSGQKSMTDPGTRMRDSHTNANIRYNSIDDAFYIAHDIISSEVNVYYRDLHNKNVEDTSFAVDTSDGKTWNGFGKFMEIHNDLIYVMADGTDATTNPSYPTMWAIQVFKVNGSGPYTYDWQENIYLNDPSLNLTNKQPLGMAISPDGNRIMLTMGLSGNTFIVPLSKTSGTWKVDETIDTGSGLDVGKGQHGIAWVNNSTCLLTRRIANGFIMQLKEGI